ncbi:MAG: 23S rRNA (guanosine(2251)-2'-O)-methyltransferase RlmB [Syntrophobacterales bacterium]|nr:23S rRNA (guanosine(2251)-2'-O)-methyltransferase RlmB [Syntrophobacterales bacterium]
MWISGVHVLEEMLRNRPDLIIEILYCRKDISNLIERAISHGISVKDTSRETLNRIMGYRQHQGVAIKIKHFLYGDFSEIIEEPVKNLSPIVLLDGLEDPQNFGSILRSAAFFGVRVVVIPEHRSVSVTDAVIRVSAGAASMVSIVRVPNLVGAIRVLSERGFNIVGLDAHAERSIYDSSLLHPLALVVGNEHKGMRRLVREHCRQIVKIPPLGEMDSLNAAVATAVALAEVSRQNTPT